MDKQILLLIFIMFLTGVFGGLINYSMKKSSEPIKRIMKIDRELFKSLVLGIGAAFLVPLFLNTISSDIVSSKITNNYNYLIFSGFCLIASISAQKFIVSITDSVLKILESRVNDVINRVERVEAGVAENDSKDNDTDVDVERNLKAFNHLVIDENQPRELKILNAIYYSRYVFRTLKGLSTATKLSIEETESCIKEMIKDGLIGQVELEGVTKFYATEKGRAYPK